MHCEVKFDNNPHGVYNSGQILSGVVELNNEKARKVRCVSLRIEGFAKCKWSQSEGSGKHRRTVHYRGREDYLNTLSYLVGSYDVSQIELTPGLHKFNFSCQLPPQLPTSFESKYGNIRYQIQVEVERPWKFDIKFSFGFTVIKIFDLNFDRPTLRNPLKSELAKTFFLGFSSKALHVSAEIPISGFVAGQSVPVKININNESSVDVEEIKVSLKKYVHYSSDSPRRNVRERLEQVADVRSVGVSGKNKGSMSAQLIIPPVAPTNIGTCNVVQVSYEIHVLARVSGFHRCPLLRIPITIGTVPLQSLYPALSQFNATSWNPMHPGTSSAPNNQVTDLYPPIYPDTSATPDPSTVPYSPNHDLPPPSYQEATRSTTADGDNDEGMTEDKPFNPMYPAFNFGAPPVQPMAPQGNEPPPSYGFTSSSPQYQEKKRF